ncbi:MAG: hypothetical protein GF341_08155, partial [candidate division Zixibacteria bacterium]|nr:hypothetical protein [candidate division Zixibacteria bacterium]
MGILSQAERDRLASLIQEGKPLPVKYRSALFSGDDAEYVEATKDYRLVYKGKMPKEAVLRTTPAAPLQHIRSFNADNPFDEEWRNMLIFGDNLLALKAIYNDQHGPDRYRTKNRIKLIYIDPPFATRQDFMKDREKAYRDKVIGAQFLEFLRRRLIIMREILADDGVVYVHLDTKKGHYGKAILDEVFGEENFLNEIVWRRSTSHSDAQKYGQVHDLIYFYGKGTLYHWETPFRGYTKAYVDRYFRFRDPDGRRYWKEDATGAGAGPARRFGDRTIEPPAGRHWRWTQDKIDEHWKNDRFVLTASGKPEFKRYLD